MHLWTPVSESFAPGFACINVQKLFPVFKSCYTTQRVSLPIKKGTFKAQP